MSKPSSQEGCRAVFVTKDELSDIQRHDGASHTAMDQPQNHGSGSV